MTAATIVLVVLAAVIATVAFMNLMQQREKSEVVIVESERGDWWGPWRGPWWYDGGHGAVWPWRLHPHHRPGPGPRHAMLGPGGTRRLVQ